MKNLCRLSDSLFFRPHTGLLLLRVMIGVVFVYHGWAKLSAMDATIGMFSSLGFGPILTYMAAYGEFLGGISLVLGIFARPAAFVLAIIMAVAVDVVHWSHGFSLMNGGYEYALTLLVGSLGLALTGPGKYSLEQKLGWHEKTIGLE